jgi:hypothetical protein
MKVLKKGALVAARTPLREQFFALTTQPDFTMSDLVTRAWNGTPIARRTTDGYVNATAMCKANGKRWKDYRESDRCQNYLDALESVAGISVHALVESRSGGTGGGGTFVHPQVAVDLARWISAPFAVWMDGWFLEEVERVSQVRDTQIPALPAPADQVKAAAEGIVFIWDALETRGLADDRDRIELKRDLKVLHTALVQTTTGQLPGTSNVLSPIDRLPRFLGRAVDVDAPLTFVEWAAAYLSGEISSVVNKYDSQLGREMAKLYRERHNDEPQTTTHLSVKAEEGRRRLNLPLFGTAKNGNAVAPKIYLPRDWDLFVVAMRHKGVIAPDKAAELLAECQQFRQGMDF